MELQIIQIGNSKGIRFPQSLLKQYHLKGKVVVDLEEDGFFIKPKKIRDGWAESFQQMAKNGDDHLILEDFKNNY